MRKIAANISHSGAMIWSTTPPALSHPKEFTRASRCSPTVIDASLHDLLFVVRGVRHVGREQANSGWYGLRSATTIHAARLRKRVRMTEELEMGIWRRVYAILEIGKGGGHKVAMSCVRQK
jgi:hypothetical protein